MRSPLLLTALAASLALGGCQTLTPAIEDAALTSSPVQAEVASPLAGAPPARGPFVSAANPYAVQAGLDILEAGGTAVDAAVAVQAVLGLVEPQSSGLGGGAFMMVYDASSREITAYDGRETAPAAATPELFYENGTPLPFVQAVLSGRSTGVPGVVAMLGEAHKDHGGLAWSELFVEAERLATHGFTVSPRLAGMLRQNRNQSASRWSVAYFTKPDGTRYGAGDLLQNPAYAQTLATIAHDGAEAFYRGRIAEEIIEAVQADEHPGSLTLEDLAAYEPIERGALCRPFRVYVICVPPPPSSGLSVLQLLEMSDYAPDLAWGPQNASAWVAFGQLQRLMYADRDRYVADPGFVGVPVQGLLDEAYVAERASLAADLEGAAPAGNPPGGRFRGPDATQEPSGTSHFVIVDRLGNAVSMTTTVESIFGSGRMAGGFFLNNQLTDFSLTPTRPDGEPAANAVAAGKRPRSSMSPVIILDAEGRLVGALGSPGGSSILAYNAKALIGTLVWDLPVQAAFDLPNLVARGDSFGADTERFSPELREAMSALGVQIRPNASENSGLHGGIWRRDSEGNWGWDGGADDRREGQARSH